jgi:hypothetical protein
MTWMKEHRSERPAVWDYANPRAEVRVSLRKKLAVGTKKPSAAPKGRKKK